MYVRPIRTETDYEAALKEVEQYFENEPELGSPESDRFDVLAALIDAYEREHWNIDAPDAVSAIREVMNIKGYTQSDLAKLLGSRSRASEILNRKRELTLDQARILRRSWSVPADSLLSEKTVVERVAQRTVRSTTRGTRITTVTVRLGRKRSARKRQLVHQDD
jgi:HTH-type transcriptional regulator / antitoxin HigA